MWWSLWLHDSYCHSLINSKFVGCKHESAVWTFSFHIGTSSSMNLFCNQPLGYVICSNCIDYNLIILIFKWDIPINFDLCPHCGDPSHGDVLNGCSPVSFLPWCCWNKHWQCWQLSCFPDLHWLCIDFCALNGAASIEQSMENKCPCFFFHPFDHHLNVSFIRYPLE